MRTITTRHFARMVSVLLAAALFSPIASAADADDVRAVVDVYLASEGDLERRARLMTDDRSFIAGGYRQTDDVTNMKNQMAAAKRNNELDPDTRLSSTGEDICIRNELFSFAGSYHFSSIGRASTSNDHADFGCVVR